MKKFSFWAVQVAAFSLCFNAQAARRSVAEAQKLAKVILQSDSVSLQTAAGSSAMNAAALRDLDGTLANEEITPYYIYNNEAGAGFVLVSGSDRMRAVIGYSDNGTIDAENIPTNMQAWLNEVSKATAWAEANPEVVLANGAASNVVVEPLLGTIAWGQEYPFNTLCPVMNGEAAVVGCVATAGAQVAYYHQYPTTGIGQYTNSSNETELTVDYSTQSYDYSQMFKSYNTRRKYTSAQLLEVAKLSYHCGVMADMEYSPEGSGTVTWSLRRGMVENFGYDPHMEVADRSCYTYDEWMELICNELSENRPVIYSGAANNGTEGHCFVVDGVDSDGLFHVNWGWYGDCNGYYDITMLNPVEDGEKMYDDGFCVGQDAIVQIAPPGTLANPQYLTPISADGALTISTTSVALGGKATFGLTNFYNKSVTTQKFKLGLAFVQEGSIVTHSIATSPYGGGEIKLELEAMYGYGEYSSLRATVPTSLADGTYRVYACAVPTEGDLKGEVGLIRCKASAPSYYTCTVADGRATFSKGTTSANVTVADWNIGSETVLANEEQEITCNVTNNDTETTLVGRFYLRLTSPSNTTSYLATDETVTIAPLATEQIKFHTKFTKTGSWSSQLYIFYTNIDENASKDRKLLANTKVTFTVGNETSGIDEIVANGTASAAVIYNLFGHKIESLANAPKGIYVVNGKKLKVEN